MKPKCYIEMDGGKSVFDNKVSDFEWSLIRFYEAFSRFVTESGSVSLGNDLKLSEHLILHIVRMQGRAKNSATIARLMNRDDIPNIQYSLRKLESAGLIAKVRDGKSNQFAYSVTSQGQKAAAEYEDIKAAILMDRLQEIDKVPDKLETMTRFLSVLTGVYEEAARGSATITPHLG